MIDLLTQYNADRAYFDVNTAVSEVAITVPANSGLMYNGNYYALFTKKDNFNILSIGYKIPLGFEIKRSNVGAANCELALIALRFLFLPSAAVRTFNSPDYIHIPFDNYEMNLGRFENWKDYAPPMYPEENFNLRFSFATDVYISMLNVPAALNGQRFYMPIFAKIQHNIALQ